MTDKTQVFVKIEDYKDILDIITLLKQKLKQARTILYQINELKSLEDVELSKWTRELEDIDDRINSIDKSLFELEP